MLKPELCEESIRILRGSSPEEAQARASEVGRSAEHEYCNASGETVRWRFVTVLEIQDLGVEELVDGVEVYSRLFKDNPQAG